MLAIVALAVVAFLFRTTWGGGCMMLGSHLTIVFGVLNLVVAVVVDQFAEQRSRDVTGMAMDTRQ